MKMDKNPQSFTRKRRNPALRGVCKMLRKGLLVLKVLFLKGME